MRHAYALLFSPSFDFIYEIYSYFCKWFSAKYEHAIIWFSQSRAYIWAPAAKRDLTALTQMTAHDPSAHPHSVNRICNNLLTQYDLFSNWTVSSVVPDQNSRMRRLIWEYAYSKRRIVPFFSRPSIYICVGKKHTKAFNLILQYIYLFICIRHNSPLACIIET